MTSREIIRRVLEFDSPPRIGYSFNAPNQNDFSSFWLAAAPKITADDPYREWGHYPELLEQVPGFNGEVRRQDGNIFGRVNRKTAGQCIRGFLEDGWENLDRYIELYLSPFYNDENYNLEKIQNWTEKSQDKFTLSSIVSLQASARDTRKIDNMLADTIAETENLKHLVNACTDAAIRQTGILHRFGVDCVMICDDWGLQDRLYINPESWREIWKNAYARLISRIHEQGMKFFLHSCGMIRSIIDDLIEIGVDVFQFDQPSIYNYDDLSGVMRGKVTLYSGADIQNVLPKADRKFIRAEAKRMMDAFHHNGGFIARDYSNYQDISVDDEWAGWAREVFTGQVIQDGEGL